MLELTKSAKFLKEYKVYKTAIDKIENDSARQRGITLLGQLQREAGIIDEAHNARNSKAIDPRTVKDNIKKLVDIRYSLDQLIKDSK